MSTRVSWPHVKQLIDNDTNGWPYNEPVVVILPDAGRRILHGLEHLNWRATYRIDDYDFADWDELQAIIHHTYQGLGDAMALKDVLTQLERIADAQEAIVEALAQLEMPDNSGIADGITGLIGLLDPRLAILIQLLDSIDDVMGGEYEPPLLP